MLEPAPASVESVVAQAVEACRPVGARITARVEPGLPLGLAIVDFLVKAHGGWVDAASGPGPGTTFTIHLPEAF